MNNNAINQTLSLINVQCAVCHNVCTHTLTIAMGVRRTFPEMGKLMGEGD